MTITKTKIELTSNQTEKVKMNIIMGKIFQIPT